MTFADNRKQICYVQSDSLWPWSNNNYYFYWVLFAREIRNDTFLHRRCQRLIVSTLPRRHVVVIVAWCKVNLQIPTGRIITQIFWLFAKLNANCCAKKVIALEWCFFWRTRPSYHITQKKIWLIFCSSIWVTGIGSEMRWARGKRTLQNREWNEAQKN